MITLEDLEWEEVSFYEWSAMRSLYYAKFTVDHFVRARFWQNEDGSYDIDFGLAKPSWYGVDALTATCALVQLVQQYGYPDGYLDKKSAEAMRAALKKQKDTKENSNVAALAD